MKISAVIRELKRLQGIMGDVEVTCTGCLEREARTKEEMAQYPANPFESTVEQVIPVTNDLHGQHVRVVWQT